MMGLLLAIVGMMATGGSCQSENKKQETVSVDTTASIVKVTATVEQQLALDREFVYLNISKEYKWYETTVLFEHFFDAEDTDFALLEVENVFQAGKTAVKCRHFDGQDEYSYFYAPWLGDFDLSEEGIQLSFEDAYYRMMEANVVKPHGRYCVLRREVGPKPGVNPHYIFGNTERQVYVDAKNGNVTDKNPAYVKFNARLACLSGNGLDRRRILTTT